MWAGWSGRRVEVAGESPRPSFPDDDEVRRHDLFFRLPAQAPEQVVRVLFVASILLPGPQFLLYVFLWFVMPDARA